MNTQSIARILFDLDPMNTSCKENDNLDEYVPEARMILALMSGTKVKHPEEVTAVVNGVFDHYFWVDCLSQQKLEEITNEISKLAGVH